MFYVIMKNISYLITCYVIVIGQSVEDCKNITSLFILRTLVVEYTLSFTLQSNA